MEESCNVCQSRETTEQESVNSEHECRGPPCDTRTNHFQRMSSHRAISPDKILEPYIVAATTLRESRCETLDKADLADLLFYPGVERLPICHSRVVYCTCIVA